MTRAVSIYLPRWPIFVARRRLGLTSGRLLLVASNHGVQWVACACERSSAAGVRPGMTLAHARSLLTGGHGGPTLRDDEFTVHELPYSPLEDAAELERLAEWAIAFSPLVAADPPGGLLLDIAGVEHLFGGEAALLVALDAALRGQGLSPRIAVAPTFGAAWALARFGSQGSGFRVQGSEGNAGCHAHGCSRGHVLSSAEEPCRCEQPSTWHPFHPNVTGSAEELREALRPLPIAALRIGETYVSSLREVGIERIGHLLEIARPDLALRFGGLLLRRLDQALGDVEETLESVRLRETPGVQRVFDGPVVDAGTIRRTARELLESLLGKLAGRGLGALHLSLEFLRIDAGPRSIELHLTHPSSSVAHLWSLLSPRLERVSLGFGVEALSLVALRTDRTSTVQSFIWQDAAADDAATTRDEGELLDRLVGRLGPGAVVRCALVERYVPEAAFSLQTVRGESAKTIAGEHRPPAGEVESIRRDRRPAKGAAARTGRRPMLPLSNKNGVGGALRACRATDSSRTVLRPAHLFETPEPLRVIALHPDGSPVRIWWRGMEVEIRRGLGPERISPPWWEQVERRAQDHFESSTSRAATVRERVPDSSVGCHAHGRSRGHVLSLTEEPCRCEQPSTWHPSASGPVHLAPRDYFLLLDGYGRWLWVYRVIDSGEWYLHGVFS